MYNRLKYPRLNLKLSITNRNKDSILPEKLAGVYKGQFSVREYIRRTAKKVNQNVITLNSIMRILRDHKKSCTTEHCYVDSSIRNTSSSNSISIP